ncbi:glycosyltransferase family 2 protein [Pedobacter hiemivivus]|uniref:Glycosyltransferase family 2 protein n=1 Tax=Pedobacter hiemivivus TaxID=2530454 RepID=A0A4U1FXX8_9SPHI|nr:glycosyltransferase family 2 protein [Pedobacter hiemivivus]TKC55808.1 glycosyltransferase family 2 protein [Pedobacter hiemivivus]
MCKVSVCIPTYQSKEQLLRNSLVALQNQIGIEDYEIIISDDSANDHVKNIVDDYDFKGKLIYTKNKNSLGPQKNWNHLLELSKGEYVKFIFHDDWLSKETSLSEFCKLLDDHPDADFAFTPSLDHFNDGRLKLNAPDEEFMKRFTSNPMELFLENRVGCPSAVIVRRRSIIPFATNLKWLVDVEWYMRILKRNPRIIYSDTSLINIGINDQQVTNECINDEEIQLREHFYIYKEHLQDNPDRNRYLNLLVALIKRFHINSFAILRKYTGFSFFTKYKITHTIISNKIKERNR